MHYYYSQCSSRGILGVWLKLHTGCEISVYLSGGLPKGNAVVCPTVLPLVAEYGSTVYGNVNAAELMRLLSWLIIGVYGGISTSSMVTAYGELNS